MADYLQVNTEDGRDLGRVVQLPLKNSGDGVVDESPRDNDEKRQSCLCPGMPASEYRGSFKRIVVLSWPVVLYMTTNLFLSMTSIIFSGHLGKDEIVASALAQSVIHVFWRSVLLGFTSGADTLFSQTYGSKNKKRVGIILQRFVLLTTLLAIICSGLLLNTEGLLLLFGQDPHIALLASTYGRIYIIATLPDAAMILFVKYLESQSIVRPIVVIIVLMAAINIGLHFVTVLLLQFGMLGAICAQVSAVYITAFLLFGYIYFRKIYKSTWPGWSWECLQEWDLVLKLSIPGMVAICIEWCSFEAGFFVAGLLGKTEVGAHAVLYFCSAFFWSISGGIGVGSAILIGNYLGANQPKMAHLVSCCSIIMSVLLGLVYSILFLSLKDVLGYIFTSESDVIQLSASLIPLGAVYTTFDSLNAVVNGILRGCGYQYIGAIVIFIAFNVIGLPLGIVLTFVAGWGLKGLWIGLMVALIISPTLLTTFIFFIKWDNEALKAQQRAAVDVALGPCDKVCGVYESEGPSADYDEAGQPDNKDDSMAAAAAEEANLNGGTTSLKTDSTQLPTVEYGVTPDPKALEGTRQEDEVVEPLNNSSGRVEVLTLNRLTFQQLLLWRGLTLFVCFGLLTIFIIVAVTIVPGIRPDYDDSVNTTVSDGSLGDMFDDLLITLLFNETQSI